MIKRKVDNTPEMNSTSPKDSFSRVARPSRSGLVPAEVFTNPPKKLSGMRPKTGELDPTLSPHSTPINKRRRPRTSRRRSTKLLKKMCFHHPFVEEASYFSFFLSLPSLIHLRYVNNASLPLSLHHHHISSYKQELSHTYLFFSFYVDF